MPLTLSVQVKPQIGLVSAMQIELSSHLKQITGKKYTVEKGEISLDKNFVITCYWIWAVSWHCYTNSPPIHTPLPFSLTGGLHTPDTPTVGMLDLGGGSTQITFSPRDEVREWTLVVDTPSPQSPPTPLPSSLSSDSKEPDLFYQSSQTTGMASHLSA